MRRKTVFTFYYFSIFLLVFFVFTCKGFSQPDRSKPNIIFILTDDQRWDALGFADNEIIQTPNMDQLAREGVYFSRAFVTTPICAASRASIATGMYERTHQFTFNTPPLKKKFIEHSYFKKLKDEGYYTGFIGKFGMEFENNMEKELFDEFDVYMPDFYYRLTGEGWGQHTYLTYITGNKAIKFLEKAPDDRPFCLNISFNAPHAEDRSPEQYIYPEDLCDIYRDITIPPPVLADRKYFRDQPVFVKEGLNRIRWYWRFDNPHKYQKMVKGYYRMITAVDEVLGEIRAALDSLGLSKNTIIIFTSDNGYFLGERGLAGKWLMYDNSLRVPFIIFDPSNHLKNNTVDRLILNIDIAPTILELAGAKPDDKIQGKSLVPLMQGNNSAWRTDFFIEHLYNLEFIPKSEGVRSEKWKYFRYIDHPEYEELYDLENDPMEINNLISDENYSDEVQLYREKCNDYIKKLIDR